MQDERPPAELVRNLALPRSIQAAIDRRLQACGGGRRWCSGLFGQRFWNGAHWRAVGGSEPHGDRVELLAIQAHERLRTIAADHDAIGLPRLRHAKRADRLMIEGLDERLLVLRGKDSRTSQAR